MLKRDVFQHSAATRYKMFLTTFVFNGAFVYVTLSVTLGPESLAAVRAAVNKSILIRVITNHKPCL